MAGSTHTELIVHPGAERFRRALLDAGNRLYAARRRGEDSFPASGHALSLVATHTLVTRHEVAADVVAWAERLDGYRFFDAEARKFNDALIVNVLEKPAAA